MSRRFQKFVLKNNWEEYFDEQSYRLLHGIKKSDRNGSFLYKEEISLGGNILASSENMIAYRHSRK